MPHRWVAHMFRTQSHRWKLDRVDWRKLGTGAVVAALGGLCGWMATEALPEILTTVEASPELAAALSALFGVAVNALRKWASGPGDDE